MTLSGGRRFFRPGVASAARVDPKGLKREDPKVGDRLFLDSSALRPLPPGTTPYPRLRDYYSFSDEGSARPQGRGRLPREKEDSRRTSSTVRTEGSSPSTHVPRRSPEPTDGLSN